MMGIQAISYALEHRFCRKSGVLLKRLHYLLQPFTLALRLVPCATGDATRGQVVVVRPHLVPSGLADAPLLLGAIGPTETPASVYVLAEVLATAVPVEVPPLVPVVARATGRGPGAVDAPDVPDATPAKEEVVQAAVGDEVTPLAPFLVPRPARPCEVPGLVAPAPAEVAAATPAATPATALASGATHAFLVARPVAEGPTAVAVVGAANGAVDLPGPETP